MDTKISLLNAFNVYQAIEIIKKAPSDLIFVDINLSGADGFECLEKIKSIPLVKYIPVYLYSTEITSESIRRARSLGAAGCIKKARRHDTLAVSISEILRAAGLQHAKKNSFFKIELHSRDNKDSKCCTS
jgi:CheY-like chemotaxis protein